MVSSTVYGFETELDQIYAILSGWGYEVLMSHKGALFVAPGTGNPQACIEAVDECDLFLGIIRPRYGSGITHEELKHAIQINKPRWFIAHTHVVFAREVFKQYMFKKRDGEPKKSFKYRKTDVMDRIDVVHMYNDAIQNDLPLVQREGHWAQPFYHFSDILLFIEYQFKNKSRIKKGLAIIRQQ